MKNFCQRLYVVRCVCRTSGQGFTSAACSGWRSTYMRTCRCVGPFTASNVIDLRKLSHLPAAGRKRLTLVLHPAPISKLNDPALTSAGYHGKIMTLGYVSLASTQRHCEVDGEICNPHQKHQPPPLPIPYQLLDKYTHTHTNPFSLEPLDTSFWGGGIVPACAGGKTCTAVNYRLLIVFHCVFLFVCVCNECPRQAFFQTTEV